MSRLPLLALALVPAVALAVPATVRHQGRLFDASGAPVNAAKNLTFALHVDGTTSANVWSELHTGVIVADGYYTAELGGSSPLDPGVFDGAALWLSVSDGATELGPRTRLGAVPYATRAAVADHVDGTTLPAFLVLADVDRTYSTGWHTTTWRETGTNAFDNGGHFDNGAFTAPVAGLYFFTTSVRIDGLNSPYVRVLISRNGSQDVNTNPHAIDGNPSANYVTLTTSGVFRLNALDTVTVQLYANADTSWTRQLESTFSGYMIAPL